MTFSEPAIPHPVNGERSDPSLATRASLLDRLRDVEDQSSWQRFYDTYARLIHSVARKAGLSDSEAEEIVQETVISVAKHLPGFQYDPKICSFKTWMLRVTRWRIIDQIRRRRPAEPLFEDSVKDDATAIDALDRLTGGRAAELEAVWDREWEQSLLDSALETLKKSANPAQFQMFELYVLRGLPVGEVAALLGVNIARIYLAKHRFSAALKKEIARLGQGALRLAPNS